MKMGDFCSPKNKNPSRNIERDSFLEHLEVRSRETETVLDEVLFELRISSLILGPVRVAELIEGDILHSLLDT